MYQEIVDNKKMNIFYSYLDAGYEYVNIDDCWSELEREDGKIVADKKRFPRGIKFLSDYVG